MIELVEGLLRELPADVLPAGGGPWRVIIRDGGAGPADTRQVFAFAAGESRPALLVKVAPAGAGARRLAGEHANLQRLAAAPAAWFLDSVPRPLAFVEREGRALLAETLLPGRRVKDLGGRAFVADAPLASVADWLTELALCAGRVATVDAAFVAEHIDAVVGRYREAFEVSPVEDRVLAALGAEARSLGGELRLAPCHGDFCDANLLWDGHRLGVVDWEGRLEPELPLRDLSYALLSFVQTPESLRSAPAFEATFRDAFVVGGRAAGLFAAAWRRHAAAIGVAAAWWPVLFVTAWCRFALAKLAYLTEPAPALRLAADFEKPNASLPLLRFEAGAALNVRLACQHLGELAFR